MRHLGWLLFVFVASCRRAPPPLPTSLDCGACHRAAVEALGSSHHAAGQQLATPKTVPAGRVGGFVITHLDGGVVISWDGGSGAAHFTIGVEPLAQVAVEVDGRLQVPPIGWQRDGGWLQVPVPPGASFDWRGPQFSWNGSCAPCHATGFRVGVTEDAGFESSWSSLAVGCRACHGDEAGHRRWLEAGRPDGGVGFAFSLRQTATFELADGGSIATGRGAGPDVQTNVCGACHARRRLLRDDGVVRADLLDRAELSLRAPGLYTPTGEVLDEVYEVGSFLMSRMERAGVRCSDCHEPHRGALRAEGNALCTRCHRPEVFDRPSHHRHQHVACVDCHMPPTTFLGVDVRHDHSIQRPSRAVCERCHPVLADAGVRRDEAFAAAELERVDADTLLLAVATDPVRSSFERASAIALRSWRDPAEAVVLARLAVDPDALLRLGVARALGSVEPELRKRLGASLLSDERLAVRVQAARALAGLVPLPGELVAEVRESARANAFKGDGWLELATLEAQLGNLDAGERALVTGFSRDPAFVPLLVTLADQRRDQSVALLGVAADQEGPFRSSAAYALGLAQWRARDGAAARRSLARAAEDGAGAHLTAWCLAERAVGGREAGWAAWEGALKTHPGHRALLELGASWASEDRDTRRAAQVTAERARFLGR